MTLKEEYKISCYEELTKLSETKEVYLVKNIENNKLYVKKKLSLYNKEIYERLSKEKLENIPKIYMTVEDKDELIVIEEYIHGQTLAEILKGDTIQDEKQSIDIMIGILMILEQLHHMQPPVIHRDIKPQNIMISNDGIVKLIDFNASRRLWQDAVEDTYFMGTVGYAAPEQYGFGQSDARTDIYACGVMLNVMLTGEFPKENLYDGKIGKIIEKCTRLEKTARYQSTEELIEELENVNSSYQIIDNMNEKEIKIEESGVSKEVVNDKLRFRKWLPVGFRTFVWWKCILALMGYFFIIKTVFETVWHDKDGSLMTGIELWMNQITELILLVGYVFYIGNYAGIRDRLKHFEERKVLNVILDILYLIIFSVGIVAICVMGEMFFC